MKICIASDTGSGYDEQYIVADAIHKYHEQHDLKAVLLLGDNIYEDGVESVDDEQFITKFELPSTLSITGLLILLDLIGLTRNST